MVASSLHHYRILHPLGAGGMGQVYAAEDTKLHRKVAVKILPADVADDPERLQRFQREAQAVAALNHPNVVTIHSVEEDAGVHFLTMELVEGRTLADLATRDGMPLADLFRIAVPLVDAIAAAHQCGIVHRDLKPANVMVGADGRVKVLDFGLAKLKPHLEAPLGDLTTAPAITLTGDQRVLGTAAYMSPEQAEGRAVDQRTDIFALGIVLYELATGVRPFQGETTLSVISSILKDSPRPICERKPDLPVELDRIVQRCLDKDPSRRYQSAIDLRHDLEDLQRRPAATSWGTKRVRRVINLVAAGLAAALLLAAAVYGVQVVRTRIRGAAAGPVQASFAQLTGQPGAELFPSLSPDGRWVVYTGEWDGNRDIYLQSATPASNPVNLTRDSSADDEEPAFSPDGEHIVFRSSRSGGGLWVMGRTGESVTRLTSAGFNPAWSPDGKRIAFTSGKLELKPQNADTSSDLYVVNATGGEPRLIHKGVALPSWSPDSRRIAFTLRVTGKGTSDIWTIDAEGRGDPIPVMSDPAIDWNPVWAPDGRHLYYASDRGGSMNLWRIPIDPASGRPLGEPTAITTPAAFVAHVSISADGRRIAYSSVLMMQNVFRLAFDPAKETVGTEAFNVTTGSRLWSSPDPTPDGDLVAFYSQTPEGHMHVIRTDGTGLRQLTGDSFIDRVPRWSPDGQWIAWFSNRSKPYQVWKIRVDGSDLQPVSGGVGGAYFAWSPDGSRMAITSAMGDNGIYVFDPNRPWDDQQPELLPMPENARRLRVTSWSPDGTQLAGQVMPLYGLGTYNLRTRTYRKWTDYGEWPVWLPDSRRMLFASEGKILLLDTADGSVRKIYSVPRDIIGPPRLTRDGRTMFFTRRVNEGDVWLASLQ